MRIRKQNDEVIYTEDQVVQVKFSDIQWLKKQAECNLRKRARLCTHRTVEDLLHEMLIVHEKGTYIRPHKHLNKTESVHIIDGLVDVVVFDDDGNITDVMQMGDYKSGRVFYYRMQYPYFHTLLIHSDILLFHEATNGPFDRKNMVFAPWAPDETDVSSTLDFLKKIENLAEIFQNKR